MVTSEITKSVTLTTTFHKPVGESNTYVRFVYGLLKICNNTPGQVSGSMNTDPVNMIHKKINKRRLEQKLEIYFRSRFYFLKQTSLHTQLPPSTRPYTNLRGNQTRMYGLDKTHIKLVITPKETFGDQ